MRLWTPVIEPITASCCGPGPAAGTLCGCSKCSCTEIQPKWQLCEDGLSVWSGCVSPFVTHKPLHVPLSVMTLYVSRVTEDPRGLVEAMDPKERRWDWDRQTKWDSEGGGGDEISMNIVCW